LPARRAGSQTPAFAGLLGQISFLLLKAATNTYTIYHSPQQLRQCYNLISISSNWKETEANAIAVTTAINFIMV
jgi:hypothetical protein